MAAAICLTLVMSFGLAGFARSAAAASLYVVPGNSLQIPAGGTAVLNVRGLSMQPGTNLPSEAFSLATQQLQASDKALIAVYYGIDWGYSDSAPDQVALAVWWTQNGNWQSTSHATAQTIADAAARAQGTPSWNPDGRNLLTAIAQGQASVSALTLTALPQTAWLGDGTLTVQNRTNSDMTVYLPYATLFSGTSGSVLVWATGVGQPSQSTPITQPTETATEAATSTVAPSDTPAATATQASSRKATAVPPSETPVQATPSPTDEIPSRKGGGQPPAQPTDTPLAGLQTKGPVSTPTGVPPTDTNTPVPPTDTAVPTDTPAPPDTATPLPTQASKGQQKSGNGGGSGSANSGQSATTNAQTSASQPGLPPADVSQSQVEAPLPPAVGPTATPTSRATTNQGSTDAAPPAVVTTNPQAQAPAPVGTTGAPPAIQTGSPPLPVDTGVPQATVPFPVQTVIPTSPSLPTKEAITQPPVDTPTQQPVPTQPVDTPTTPQKPTPVPTPAPAPGNSDTGQPPVIVVGPSSTAGNTDTGNGNGGNPSGNSQGSPPKKNPVTGAGPSSMPLWLATGAFIMLLGGWALRRAGRSYSAIRVKVDENKD